MKPLPPQRIYGDKILTSKLLNSIIKRIEFLAYILNVPSLYSQESKNLGNIFYGARGTNGLFTANIPPGGTAEPIYNIFNAYSPNTSNWFYPGLYTGSDLTTFYTPVSPSGIVVSADYNLTVRYTFGATKILLSANGPKIINNRKFQIAYQGLNFSGQGYTSHWSSDNWTFTDEWRGATAASRTTWIVTQQTKTESGFN